MIANGAPITEVQHRLGHASPAITLQIYSHFIPQTESAAADRLANSHLRNSGSPTESGKSGHSVGTHEAQTVVAIGVNP